MSQVDAVFRKGVFEPLDRVDLRENERVRLVFQPVVGADLAAWLRSVEPLHRQILHRSGPLPDSSVDIAADRTR